ncbi:MAG: hypothetical protein LH606_09615 [Cytophagaceae bacterium]|nr:hypothetical protein [Cytophagaceae bacterium]
MKSKNSPRFGVLITLILLAAFSRLIPHAPNFTAVGAMALFGGAYFSRKSWALAVPLLALWLSDIVLNNVMYRQYYPTFTLQVNPWTYGTFAVIVVLGAVLLKRVKPLNVVFTSVLASTLFFLMSNFSVWLGSGAFPQTPGGLMACYTVALPFFGNTLAGDLFWCGVLFGVFEFAKRRFPELSLQKT